MGSFAEGMRMGSGAYQQMVDNQLAREKADREAQRFAWETTDRERTDKMYRDVAQAGEGLDNLKNGVYTGGNTSGFSDQSARMLFEQGGQAGLDEAASYANVENRRMGLAPSNVTSLPAQAGGLSVPTVQSRQATDLDYNGVLQNIMRASHNWSGFADLQGKRRGLQVREVADAAAKIPLAEIENAAYGFNKNTSNYPIIYNGPSKDEKGKPIYNFQTLDAEGRTGPQMPLTEPQLRQLYLSHQLGQAGFGEEALSTLAAAHKDIGDHIGKWSDAASKVSTNNNDALHKKNTDDENVRYHNQQAGYYRNLFGGSKTGSNNVGWQIVGQDKDGGELYRNSDGRMGLFRIGKDGNPEQVPAAEVRALKGITAAKPVLSPEETQKYRDALQGLGPRPDTKTGMFGGKDDAAGKAWDKQKAYIDQVYGASGSSAPSGGLPVVAPPPPPSNAPTPRANYKGQSGSHAPVDTRVPPPATNPQVAARVREIDMRLGLAGVAPEIKYAMIQEREALTGGTRLGHGNRFMPGGSLPPEFRLGINSPVPGD